MKNVSSLKSNASNSPKTPGGISKSLLTPCRRVGLSRNWRNKGPSPFISPLSGNVPEVKDEKIGNRKRKERVLDDNIDKTPETSSTVDRNEIKDDHNSDIDKTPSRTVEMPRRKKSKTLLSAINKSQEEISTASVTTDESIITQSDKSDILGKQNIENTIVVSTPVRSKSKKSKKRSSPLKSGSRDAKMISDQSPVVSINENIDIVENEKELADTVYKIKEKSPNDLRKECIVVIQRKIFKKTENIKECGKESKIGQDEDKKSSSQALFDSDSDDMPLNQLNNINIETKTDVTVEQIINKAEHTKNLDEDDFVDKSTRIARVHVNKLKEIKSPNNILKTSKSIKTKVDKVKVQPKPSSQSSYDDDFDDDFDNKKTILIRKTYEKNTKPLKSKSTGSITQKDIDELKARIESKKKLLLAQSLTPETEELRTLIKKWQKGCQEALKELLDLMKNKFDDKQNMDYSVMLKTLKIPPDLVGYDSENDCFNSPDDASIILGQFKDT